MAVIALLYLTRAGSWLALVRTAFLTCIGHRGLRSLLGDCLMLSSVHENNTYWLQFTVNSTTRSSGARPNFLDNERHSDRIILELYIRGVTRAPLHHVVEINRGQRTHAMKAKLTRSGVPIHIVIRNDRHARSK
ncbi:hypothetical protein BC835DRAFT_480099 [Cytidiella melzeri]|nr:hypothetical protein BC835DRAFT_480099 [Cytidiella melzeri]